MTALERRRKKILPTIMANTSGDGTYLTSLATAQSLAMCLVTVACACRREPMPPPDELAARIGIVLELLGLPLEVPNV